MQWQLERISGLRLRVFFLAFVLPFSARGAVPDQAGDLSRHLPVQWITLESARNPISAPMPARAVSFTFNHFSPSRFLRFQLLRGFDRRFRNLEAPSADIVRVFMSAEPLTEFSQKISEAILLAGEPTLREATPYFYQIPLGELRIDGDDWKKGAINGVSGGLLLEGAGAAGFFSSIESIWRKEDRHVTLRILDQSGNQIFIQTKVNGARALFLGASDVSNGLLGARPSVAFAVQRAEALIAKTQSGQCQDFVSRGSPDGSLSGR